MVLLLAALTLQIPEPPSAYDRNGKRAGYLSESEAIYQAARLEGQPAPAFVVFDTAGKSISSKSLYRKPSLLFFIEPACPCCDAGQVYFGRLQKLYPTKVQVLGLVYGSKEVAENWRLKNRPAFRIAADPAGKVARAFRAAEGLAVRLIDAKGKIVAAAPGYSALTLDFMAGWIGSRSGGKRRKFETAPAGAAMASGCPLGSHAQQSGSG